MLRFIRVHTRRTRHMLLALLLTVPALGLWPSAHAAFLSSESVTLGTSVPSAVTTHDFRFTIASTGNVGSIQIQYCSFSPFPTAPCTPPPGLDVSATTLDFETGATGFGVDALTTANSIILSRPSSSITAGTPVRYTLGNITNPSTPRQSFYIRLKTFASVDGSGPILDDGAVVASTSGQLQTGGYVPPYITFCVGVTVAIDCSSTTGFTVDLGEMSETTTAVGTSQFAVATNYPLGYIVFLSGNALLSGNNTVPSLASPSPSSVGVSQFGINLVANTTPGVGANATGVGTGTPAAGYNSSNLYQFVSGAAVARSVLPSDFNRFTVSHIANVSADQKPGVYNTTFQYLAVAQF